MEVKQMDPGSEVVSTFFQVFNVSSKYGSVNSIY